MKILIVNTDLDIGGGENSLISFLANIDLNRYQVDLGILQPKLGMADRLDPRINLIKLYEKPKLPEYDAVIGFKQGKATKYAAGKVNAKIKIARFAHGSIKYKGFAKLYYKFIYKKFRYILVSNKGMSEMLQKGFGFSDNKIKVIPNLFDCETVINKSCEYHIEKDTKYVFSTLARIGRVKRIDLIPIVAKKLTEKGFDDFKWYVVGKICDDKYNRDIFSYVEKSGLKDKIIFTDNLLNPFPYLKISDICVSLSDAEGWSRSVIEAFILKTPVLSTKTVGGLGQIIPGKNGELCEIGNADDIAEKLLYMLENLSRYSSAEYKADNKEIMEKYYKLFEQIPKI